MKRLALLFLLLASCAGITAREEVLMPTMSLAYREVLQPHVVRGVEERVDAGTIDAVTARAFFDLSGSLQAALDSGDRTQLIGIDWPSLRIAATGGIQLRLAREEIGAGVALSILETLAQFDTNYTLLLARRP